MSIELWILLWVVCGLVAWTWATIGWVGQVTVSDVVHLPLILVGGGVSLCMVLGFALVGALVDDGVLWRRKK